MKKLKHFIIQSLNIKEDIIDSCVEISCYLCSIIFFILGFLELSYKYHLVLLTLSMVVFFMGFVSSHNIYAFIAILIEAARFALCIFSAYISIFLLITIIQRKEVILSLIYGIISLILMLLCFLYMSSRFIYIVNYVKSLFHKSQIVIPEASNSNNLSLKLIVEHVMPFLLTLTTIISTIINIFK